MSIESFKKRIAFEDEIDQLRFVNWGIWSNIKAHPNLDPATWYDIWAGYISDDRIRNLVAEQDAQHIEDAVIELYQQYIHNKDSNPKGARKWGYVWFTVLKIKYHDPDRPTEAMAREARHKLKRRCSKRTFQHHVKNARDAVIDLAISL